MALEVFWGSGSGPAWRVLLALAVKQVDYESHLLSFSKGEHKTPEMLALSPRGKVPVLRDGAYVLCESLAILTYLDRKYPDPPLFGETPEQAGDIVRAVMEHECYGVSAISAFSRPLLFGKLDAQRDQVLLAIDGAKNELDRLEAALASRPFLVTPTLSAADIFVYPLVKSFERALGKPGADTIDHGLGPLPAVFPRLAAWCARIEALPGYDATYPPHWRETA
ncbi:MAG: glutathione S-transferase family protein [Myxococcales bacterium]|nr:glutathione S-transferase family protein [Myxococcales bacterium]